MKSKEELEKLNKEVCMFLDAQDKAEQKGEHEFTCPLCGGKAYWSRSSYNNHLHAKCNGCDMVIME